MDRAKEQALERCPKSENVIEEMRNEIKRAQFVEGYHQAEKDLVLTYHDVARIFVIADTITKENTAPLTDKAFYQEVLKRFLETRH